MNQPKDSTGLKKQEPKFEIIPSQDIQGILFSTITKKLENATLSRSSVNPRTVALFKNVLLNQLSSKAAAEITSRSLNSEAEQQRERFLIEMTKMKDTRFVMQKKGKTAGGIKLREVHLKDGDFFKFSQSKGSKEYPISSNFLAQTKDEYDVYKIGLPWISKGDFAKVKQRILIQRHAKNLDEKEASKKKAESPRKKKAFSDEYDSAFYFEKVDDYLKVRNYMQLLKILDRDDKSKAYNQRIPSILFSMSESFRLQLVAKTRKNVRRVADQLEQDKKQLKQESITNSIILKSFDNFLRKSFLNRMAEKASGVSKEKRMGEERYRRRRMIIEMLDGMKTIKNYDRACVNLLMMTWARLAEMRGLPDRETIRITFGGIEIPKTVIKPIFRVHILVQRKSTERSYPGPVNINGEPSFSEEKEILLNAILRYKVSEKSFYWKLASHSIETVSSKASETNDRFTLNLDSMSREYLDCVQLKFTLHDENDNLRALYFVRLDHLYLPSKKGKDIAFAIGEEHNVQHIVFLQVHSHLPDRPFVNSRTKSLTADYLQDTFFNFAFPYPKTTPRHHKFLCLLPESWRILDDNMRNTHRSGNLGKWIQRVKYRLARHYHKKSAGHIAKLEKANVLWAELQTELAIYSAGQSLEQDQIYIDTEHLERLTDIEAILKNPNRQPLTGPNSEHATVVSYLFKRDRWENVQDWKPFYQKLRDLCILGLPSQLRKIIWSELGHTCYFIKLTENMLKIISAQDPEFRLLDDKFSPDELNESKRVYENLKYQAFRRYYYVYQELEEDIDVLKKAQGKKKLDYEHELRSICKSFIHWSHTSAEFPAESFRLYVSYSRSLLTLCQSLIISLNSNYLHSETHIEEDIIFWLLVSLTAYILSSYYETNEDAVSVDISADSASQKSRKNNKFTTSALRCFEMRGIKGDLLLLRLLVREKLPEVFQKFEEMGLPLEQYFADHMLTLFSTLFSPTMVFRLWDIIFLEGSASNQVRSHRTIVIAVFSILQNCKKMLLTAKNSNEIQYILDIYTKFEVDFDDFINQIQYNVAHLMEQTLPDTQTVTQKLNYIKFVFSNNFNKYDNTILEIEDTIRDYNRPIFDQNMTVFALLYPPKLLGVQAESRIDNLPFTLLSEVVKKFFKIYAYPEQKKQMDNFLQTKEGEEGDKLQKQSMNGARPTSKKMFAEAEVDSQRFLRTKFTHIQLMIHRLNIYWPELEFLTLRVAYEKETFDKVGLSTLEVDFPAEFLITSTTNIARYVTIELINHRDKQDPKKIKTVSVDLRSLTIDCLTKLVLKFDEITTKHFHDNFTTSEIELSILLVGAPREKDISELAQQPRNLVIPALEIGDQKKFDSMKLETIFQRFSGEHDEILSLDSMNYTLFNKSKTAWKENFRMNYQEFAEVTKKVMPFWQGRVDFSKLYTSIQMATPGKNFYFNDFMTLLILFAKFSFRKKLALLFEMYAAFNDTFRSKEDMQVPSYVIHGIASFLYDAFMIYIPQNDIDNMLDTLLFGSSTLINKAIFNGDSENKIILSSSTFNHLANYMHLYFYSKDVYLGDAEMMKHLKEVFYMEKQSSSKPEAFKINQRNKFEVLYYTNGMRHRYKVEFDDNWQVLSDSKFNSKNLKLNMRLLYHNKNVVPLNHANILLNQEQFIELFERLPMMGYLCGFENTIPPIQHISSKTKIVFEVKHNQQLGYAVFVDHDFVSKKPYRRPDDKKPFNHLIKEWRQLAKGVQESVSPLSTLNKKSKVIVRDFEDEEDQIYELTKPHQKLSVFFPLKKLVQQIKRYVIKDLMYHVSERLSQGLNPPKNHLILERLWDLDYSILVSLNEGQHKRITNFDNSLFQSLYEIENALQAPLLDINVVIDFQNSRLIEPSDSDTYNQLALYRYADSSTEWLSCKIEFKFLAKASLQASKRRGVEIINYEEVDGFGVTFERFPEETVLKKRSEVALIHDLDLTEIPTRVLEDLLPKPEQEKPTSVSFRAGSGANTAGNVTMRGGETSEILGIGADRRGSVLRK